MSISCCPVVQCPEDFNSAAAIDQCRAREAAVTGGLKWPERACQRQTQNVLPKVDGVDG
jgi:hypothetical protein